VRRAFASCSTRGAELQAGAPACRSTGRRIAWSCSSKVAADTAGVAFRSTRSTTAMTRRSSTANFDSASRWSRVWRSPDTFTWTGSGRAILETEPRQGDLGLAHPYGRHPSRPRPERAATVPHRRTSVGDHRHTRAGGEYFGKPIDIEWAFAAGRLTCCRPAHHCIRTAASGHADEARASPGCSTPTRP